MVLVIMVFGILEQAGLPAATIHYARGGALAAIAAALVLVYKLLQIANRRQQQRGLGNPLHLRKVMHRRCARECGPLERRLELPEADHMAILLEVLQDQMLAICDRDALHLADMRRRIEESGFARIPDVNFREFFQEPESYDGQALGKDLALVGSAASRLEPYLEQLKRAHRYLFTLMGDYLSALPTSEKAIERIERTYRYRPPGRERARRLAFAMMVLRYLEKNRNNGLKPAHIKRLTDLADLRIPALAQAMAEYRQAWQALVDAYEAGDGK
jgi:hypothetical protein